MEDTEVTFNNVALSEIRKTEKVILEALRDLYTKTGLVPDSVQINGISFGAMKQDASAPDGYVFNSVSLSLRATLR